MTADKRLYTFMERQVSVLWFHDKLNTAQIARELKILESLADRIVSRLVGARYSRLRDAERT